jgi:hypothetical protein
MKPDKDVLLFTALTFIALPIIMWGVLLAWVRVRNPNLRPMVAWLHAVQWGTWLLGAPLAFVGVLYNPLHWLFTLGAGMAACSSGFGAVNSWVKRRYAPELVTCDSTDGYWPSPRS